MNRNTLTNPVALTIGIINNLIFISVIGYGCISSNFTCDGDNMGGVMMVYAFTLFWIQLPLFCFYFIFALFLSRNLLDVEFREKLSTPKKTLIALFLTTTAIAVPLWFV